MTTFTLNNGHTFMKKDNGYCYAIVNNTKTRIALPVFNANHEQFVKEENERQNAANEFTNIDPIVERKAHEQELEDALREAEQNLNRAVMGGDQEEIHQASNDLTKARAEWDNRNLDAAAENPEISAEQFCEMIQQAEESATTEQIEEIQKEMAPKAKKESKPRKSKDIAYEGNGVTLTAKQVDFIKHLPDTCFWERGLDSRVWCDILADEIGGQFAGKPMTTGAMLSTICEKGLGTRCKDRMNGRKCTSFALTELGKIVAAELGLH